MSEATMPQKSERLVARISPKDKAAIKQAAELEGLSLTSFIVTHLRNHSQTVLENHSFIRLNKEESIRFVTALQEPPRRTPPSMKRAIKEYRESVTEH